MKPKAQHEFSIINTDDRPYLKWLVDGTKTAEGRVNSPKYQRIKIGDSILFEDQSTGKFIFGTVYFKHEYKSFKEMLLNEGVTNMLPFLKNDEFEEAIAVYQSFPKSERVKIFGCVAIGIKVLESGV